MKKIIKNIYTGIIVLFLYAPILTLVVLSFNTSRSRAKWGGFTLKWYFELFRNQAILQSLWNTLYIALVSSLIATVIAVPVCMAMKKMGKRGRDAVTAVANIPMMNADIVTGISLMLLFITTGLRLSMETVLIAHITFNIPYVLLSVWPRMRAMDDSLYEAALDLGSTPVHAFFHVVLPDIFPGVLSGFLMAFTMSVDDFIITHFTKGAGLDTLSTKIYTEVKKGIKPEIYAVSTIIFVIVVVIMTISTLVKGMGDKPSQMKKH